jgi:hypothetical protein
MQGIGGQLFPPEAIMDGKDHTETKLVDLVMFYPS